LDVWLKGHSGDTLRVDRKGRAPEYIKRPALTLLLTVQPSVLTAVARNGTFRGRGLTARFLYSIPEDNLGRRLIGAEPVPQDIADTYHAEVRKLVDDLAEWTDPAVLTLSPAAAELLLDTERTIEPRLLPDGEFGLVRDWASKLAGAVVRIAGLLHLAADSLRRPISVETMAAAVRIGLDYFAEHARAAFGLLGETGTSDAAYVLEHLHSLHLKEFTVRDLMAALPRGRFATADAVAAAVAVLADHGWVAERPSPPRKGAGRKPSPTYVTHPDVATESTQSTE
jgi:hypothetical protein